MGKRELFIIAAFAALGLVVYQLTVTRRGTDRPLSVSAIMENISHRGRRPRSTVSVVRRGTGPVADTVTTLQVSGVANPTVIGERRNDMAYEVTVEAYGADEPSAQAAAEKTGLGVEGTASTLTLSPTAPIDASFTMTVVVRVPERLDLWIDGAGQTDVSGVNAVVLARTSDQMAIRDIAGAVTGSHRNGELTIARVGRLSLTISETRARIASVRESARLSARTGESRLEDIGGPIDIDLDRHRTALISPAGDVQVTGVDGGLHIDRPRRDIRVRVRRTDILLRLDRAVPTTVSTTERKIELQIDPQLPVVIDARSEDMGVTASDLGLSPEKIGREWRLHHRIGSAAEITLKNQRGEIVIAQMK